MLGNSLIGLAVLVIALWHFGIWGLLALLWLPWAWWVARQHAARAGYSINARLVTVRAGWWSRHWRFAEIDKIHALQLRRSPLDHCFGMASVWIDIAGQDAMTPALRIRHLPLVDAQALFKQLEREVARRPLRW